MISTINNTRYRLQLEEIRRRMQNNKVKPIEPTDTQGEVGDENQKRNKTKQSK